MYQNKSDVFICFPKRTAIGSFMSSLAALPAPKLAAPLLASIVEDSGLEPEKIDSVILGSVLQADQGQAPARQASIYAGLPKSVQALAINKVCSSGLKAVMLASNEVELGQSHSVLAGGMESMSNAPHYLPSARAGQKLGHGEMRDAILRDGLWDIYGDQHMGNCAELCAREYKFSRKDQDEYALSSYDNALKAIEEGAFKDEIFPIEIPSRKGSITVDTDEEPGRLKRDKVGSLRAAFEKDGTVTAANASSLNDGAAAMLVCSADFAKVNNLQPVARIVGQGWFAHEPEWFTTAPVSAIQRLCERCSTALTDVDLFEVNEAFSAVAMAAMKDLSIPREKLNVRGGAVALGHPIGASGARILVTLIHALKSRSEKRGIAALCNGGGEATAMMVELV